MTVQYCLKESESRLTTRQRRCLGMSQMCSPLTSLVGDRAHQWENLWLPKSTVLDGRQPRSEVLVHPSGMAVAVVKSKQQVSLTPLRDPGTSNFGMAARNQPSSTVLHTGVEYWQGRGEGWGTSLTPESLRWNHVGTVVSMWPCGAHPCSSSGVNTFSENLLQASTILPLEYFGVQHCGLKSVTSAHPALSL